MTIRNILDAWCGTIDGIEVYDSANKSIGHWEINNFVKYIAGYAQGDEYKNIPEEVMNIEIKNFTMGSGFYMLFYIK